MSLCRECAFSGKSAVDWQRQLGYTVLANTSAGRLSPTSSEKGLWASLKLKVALARFLSRSIGR